MNPQHVPAAPRPILVAVLRGRWLGLARAGWVVLTFLSLGLFIAGIPAEFAQLQVVCPTEFCASGQLPPAGLRALRDLGLSLDFYTVYGVALDILFAAVYSAIAALIFWRTSADRLALFGAFALLTFGTVTHPTAADALAAAHPAWWPPVAVLNFLGSACFGLFLYLFPNGRFVPRWTRWVALAWLAWQVPKYWSPSWPSPDLNTWPTWLNAVVWLGALGTVVYGQVYRYRRVSSAVQRQQTKWVIFGIAAALMAFLGIGLALDILVPAPDSAGALLTLMVGFTIIQLALLCIPLSIGIAMLRYHLFDIDVLINRTLVYGALTVALALVYVSSIVLLQALFRVLTGEQQSELVIVGSTLAIAALFTPLRRRSQLVIDRRFYRRKYNAAQVLTGFSARLRDQVDLNMLSDDLLAVVEETLQPAHVSLWVRTPVRKTAARKGTDTAG